MFDKKLLCLFMLVSVSFSAGAQTQKMNLSQIVSLAINNNHAAKQGEISVELSRVDKNQSWQNMLPSVSANAGYNYSTGFNFDANTNQRIEDNQQNMNFGVSAGLNLFDGLQNINSYRRAQLAYLSQKYGYDKILSDLTLQVVNQYISAIASAEFVKITEDQYKLSQMQLERVKAQLEAGKAAEGDYYDAQATNASDLAALTEARGQYALALLSLKQLAGIDVVADIELDTNFDDVPMGAVDFYTPQGIYSDALTWYPSIKKAEKDIELQKRSIQIARGGFSPTLSFAYNWSNGFIFDYMNPLTQQNISTGQQWDNNHRHVLGLSLRIPVFSRMQTINGVKIAKLNYEYQKIALEQEKQNLLQVLEKAFLDALASQESFFAAQAAAKAGGESLKYATERYEVGKMSSYDFQAAKNRLLKAESEVLRTKYDYIFKVKLLQYYKDQKI